MQLADTLTQAAIASFRRVLGEANNADPARGTPLCVIVDPVLHDPSGEVEDTQTLIRLPLSIDTLEPELRPYLLVIDDSIAQERVLNSTFRVAAEELLGRHDGEAGQPRSVCAWITADDLGHPQAQRDLALALSRCATIAPPPPYPRERTVFRYWDPRIAMHLSACLGEAWARALCAMRLRGWWGLQPNGMLTCFSPLQKTGTDSADLAFSGFAPNAHQWQTLLAIGWCNRVAQLLPAWELPHAPEIRVVEDAVRQALSHGLHEEIDILGFVHCALSIHPLFYRHDEVARSIAALPAAGPHRSGFAALPTRWDDELTRVLHSGQWLNNTATHKPRMT